MDKKMFMEFCSKKKVYEIVEHGWYYWKTLFVTDDRAEAIHYWERLTMKKFSQYETYVQNADTSGEGFWYIGFDEHPMDEVISKYEKDAVEATVTEQADRILKKGNNAIKAEAIRNERERTKEILEGMLYYLRDNYAMLSTSGIGVQREMFNKYAPPKER